MRRTYHLLIATLIAAAPMPVAAQVSVDLNALNRLGGASLPEPPPSSRNPATVHRHHRRTHHLTRAERPGHHAKASAVAAGTPAPAGPRVIEHPAHLGPSFASLPALPGAAPPLPAPPPALPSVTPKPAPPPKPAVPPAPAPTLALPGAIPPPPAISPRLAEATPPPPAAQPAPVKPAPSALPTGADRLTLPFFVQQSDLPPAENAMLRDFAQRYGAGARYIVRAFASPPAGDDDPSTPRRIALARAQSVAAALMGSGVPADRVRLLALGNSGGAPADRVEVIAMPPSSGHTTSESTP